MVLSLCLVFGQVQPGVAYLSVAFKKEHVFSKKETKSKDTVIKMIFENYRLTADYKFETVKETIT